MNPRQIGQEIPTSMPPGDVSRKIQAQARECKEVEAGLGLFQPLQDFPSGSVVKNLPPVQETQEMQVQSLGWEDPLEKGMATHSSILPGESHGQRSLAGYSAWGSQRVRHD